MLPSGVPWTFLKNTMKIAKSILLDVAEWIFAVLGGDDGSIARMDGTLQKFNKSEQLRMKIVTEEISPGYFQFHSFIHDETCSTPDLLKMLAKFYSRRYTGNDISVEKQVAEYQVSFRDVLQTMPSVAKLINCIRLNAEVHACDTDVMLFAVQSLYDFANTDPSLFMQFLKRRRCITLPTIHPGPWTGDIAFLVG
jgi:hypothetical protein